MYRSFLSWRYMFARRTNLIGIVGIFVAVAALILILSIMTGFLEESRRTVRGSLSDIILEPLQRSDPFSPNGSLRPHDPRDLLEAVRSDPRVAGAAPQLVWGGIITQRDEIYSRLLSSRTHGSMLAVQLVGIDPADEFETTNLLASLTGGLGRDEPLQAPVADPLDPFATPPGYAPEGRMKASVVIGDKLAELLELDVGQELSLITAVPDPETGDYGPSNRDFVVAGTFRSGENEMDVERIYMARDELSDFLGGTRSFTQVLVRLHDYEEEGAAVCADLRQDLAEKKLIRGGFSAFHEVRTWEEFRGNLLGAIENERVLMGIMLSLVLVVAGFTVFAILSMLVSEKRRDIGILCALGATQRGILSLFLMIAFWDALLGAIVGAALGTWAAVRIDPIERWLSETFQVQIFNRDVYLFDHIPSIVEPVAVALIVLFAFTCALLFAAIPAWRAARLDPLDALRYE